MIRLVHHLYFVTQDVLNYSIVAEGDITNKQDDSDRFAVFLMFVGKPGICSWSSVWRVLVVEEAHTERNILLSVFFKEILQSV